MNSTAIVNGTIATSAGAFNANVVLRDGRVAQLGGEVSNPDSVLDASGCLVLPGGVDVHTHLDAPTMGMPTADDFRTGTIAAACGGTTTIVDFCQQTPGHSLADGIAAWDRKAEGKAAIDYGYHMLIPDLRAEVVDELTTLPERGVTSFKLFMSGKFGPMVDDMALVRALAQAKACGALVMVHAENGDIIHHLQQTFLAEGKTEPKYHGLSRPARAEAEATARAIAFAEIIDTPIYIVHVSSKEALEEVLRGKARGAPVTAETCTHYLYLTQAELDRPGFEGAKYVFSPPARTENDQEALWCALRNGVFETVSSDHSSTRFHDQKQGGLRDFTLIPNGLPGIEERLVLFYQGVVSGRISLEQFVDLVASRPARNFGLSPRKGALTVGADADIVVFDPAARQTISQSRLHHAVDYTAYEGLEVSGAVRDVFLRGKRIVQGGTYVGTPGEGIFLPRARFPRIGRCRLTSATARL